MRSSYWGMRHPRTTQEIRYNCDEDHKQFTRGKRRNLPTAWDDLYGGRVDNKSWKEKRKTQYHQKDTSGWDWHEFRCEYGNESYMLYRNLWDTLYASEYWFEHIRWGLRWYGPDLLK